MICCASVPSRGMNFPRPKPCQYEAVVERDGKFYCKRHDPVALAEKAKVRDKKQEAAREKKSKIWAYLKYGKGKK